MSLPPAIAAALRPFATVDVHLPTEECVTCELTASTRVYTDRVAPYASPTWPLPDVPDMAILNGWPQLSGHG